MCWTAFTTQDVAHLHCGGPVQLTLQNPKRLEVACKRVKPRSSILEMKFVNFRPYMQLQHPQRLQAACTCEVSILCTSDAELFKVLMLSAYQGCRHVTLPAVMLPAGAHTALLAV